MTAPLELFASLIRSKNQAYPNLQTLGELTLYKDKQKIFSCKTLELPDKDNQRSISRINLGSYWVVPRTSQKYGLHFHVTDVDGRSYILIHAGNYYTQIRGCILVGDGFKDINADGVQDVVNSKKTLNELLKLAPDGFKLTIYDQD